MKIMKTLYISFVLCCGWSFAADILDHPCRTTVPAKENFSTGFYSGVWFELYNNEHTFDGNCITHRYGRRGTQHVFDVDRSYIFDHVFYEQYTNVSVTNPEEVPMRGFLNGTAIYPDGTVNAYEYQVYATDYSNYSLLWSCRSVGEDQSIELVSILGRSKTMSESVLAKTDALLGLIGFDSKNFRGVGQSEEICTIKS